MKINMNEWKDTVLSSENRIAIPIMTHSGIELIGHTVKEAVTMGKYIIRLLWLWQRNILLLLHL